jgi:nicotinamidase-related amidase
MTHREVPIERSALLVIDIQDSFKATPRWERRSSPRFEENVDRLVRTFRAAGLPVIFVLHTDSDPEFQAGSPYFKLMDFLAPAPGEPVLVKNTRNAFTSTNLQELLREKGVERLVITGIQTEQCCETTTRLAADLGYDVDFVTEATMTFPIPNPETGEELSTDEILRRTEFVLRRRFARIATVGGLVAELEKTAVLSLK